MHGTSMSTLSTIARPRKLEPGDDTRAAWQIRWLARASLVFCFLAMPCPVVAQVTLAQLIGPAVEKPDDPRYQAVADAIGEFFQGELENARALLIHAKNKNPELAPADVMFAQLCVAAGEPGAGRTALDQAVNDEPADPEAYLLLGEIALADSRLTEAELLFQRGYNLCENLGGNERRKSSLTISGSVGLAAVAEIRGRWADVERFARVWIAADENSAPAHERLGVALFMQGQYRDAYQTFQAAFKRDPSRLRPEISMGLLYEQLAARGQTEMHNSARNAMNQAVNDDKDGLSTRLAVTQWALDSCELEIAKTNAQAALRIDPDSFDANYLAGLVARHERDFVAAESAFRTAHLQSPANPAASNQLALALIEQGGEDKTRLALQFAQLAVQGNPDRDSYGGREAALTLSWVLFRLSNTNDALRTARIALSAGSLGGDSGYFAAMIVNDAGHAASATAILKSALAGNRCFPTRADAEALLKKLTADENGGQR